MDTLFSGPAEVDETYAGGKRVNMSNANRNALTDTARGSIGKTGVVRARGLATTRVAAKVVKFTNKDTLQGFVKKLAAPGASVCTNDAKAYDGCRLVMPLSGTRRAERVREG